MIESKIRVRRLAPKTRTGCLTCKRRRIKCDERKPFCLSCERAKRHCDGYQIPKAWIFESKTSGSTTLSDSDTRGDSYSDSSSRDHSGTVTPAPDDNQDKMVVMKSPINRPPLYPYIVNNDQEEPQLVHSYFEMQGNCPMAWDGDLYRNNAQGRAAIVNDSEALMLLPRAQSSASSTLMTRRARLVLIASALRHFEPHKYPSQLYVRYQQMAVMEIRKRILQQGFDIDDLLHGISRTFLAAVLHGADAAARAHLSAAQHLVTQKGGIDNVDSSTAAALRYGDFAYAVQTLSPPTFRLGFDPAQPYPGDTSIVDPVFLHLGKELRRAAEMSLSNVLAQAISRFTQSAISLVHSWTVAYPDAIDLYQLTWIASHVASTLNILLDAQPVFNFPTSSANFGLSRQYPSHAYESSRSTPSPSSSSTSASINMPPDQADYIVILVFWCQLLICCANECLTKVDIRGNFLPVYSNESPTSLLARTTLSPPVICGLERWNGLVQEARTNTKVAKGSDDWLQLFEVVEGMELYETVKLGPFMQRLLTSRAWRIHRSRDMVDQDMRDMFLGGSRPSYARPTTTNRSNH